MGGMYLRGLTERSTMLACYQHGLDSFNTHILHQLNTPDARD